MIHACKGIKVVLRRKGITQVTFTGSHFAETIERAILEVEEKISLQEILRLDQRSVALPSKSSVDTPS